VVKTISDFGNGGEPAATQGLGRDF